MTHRNVNSNGFRMPIALGVVVVSMSLCGIVSAYIGSDTTDYVYTDSLPALVYEDSLAVGLECKAGSGYCSALALDFTTVGIPSGFEKWGFTWEVEFSDQMNGGKSECPSGAFVTGLSCYGDWCAVKRLQCTQMYYGGSPAHTGSNCTTEPAISEETWPPPGNHATCSNANTFIVGMEASGYYSDNMSIICCDMVP